VDSCFLLVVSMTDSIFPEIAVREDDRVCGLYGDIPRMIWVAMSVRVCNSANVQIIRWNWGDRPATAGTKM